MLRTKPFRSWLHSLFTEFRFASRQLHKSPAFTLTAVLTLALGIGANTAIFSLVNSVLLRSLPFSNASELVYVSSRSTMFDFPYIGLSLPDLADLRSASTCFTAIAASEDSPKELSGAGRPQRLESTAVTEDFFPLLGLEPLYGRTFTSADMQPGMRSVILSESVWRENFGGDPSAIGKTIMLDGQPFTIVGVMRALASLGFETDSKLWTALVPNREQVADRSNHFYGVIARLRPNTPLARAQAELDTLSSRLASSYPGADKGWSIHATSLKQYLVGDARSPFLMLSLAVGFVLLIACANVSNLFLARGWARRKEFAIRAAIGASRLDLVRQLALESCLIAVIGGVCGFALATWSLQALRSALPPDIPRLQELRMDSLVWLFAAGISVVALLLSGLAPALISTRDSLSDAMKQDTTSLGSSMRPNVVRQALVVCEIALAAVLLIGATLMLRSFAQMLRSDLGFRPDHVLTVRLDFPKFRFPSPEPAITYVRQVLGAVRGIPGISSASAGQVFPMSDEVGETTFATDATMADPQHAQQSALGNRVTPDFFCTLGIPLFAGRDFAVDDAKGKTPPVFIVNEVLAKKYFGTIDVVGKRLATEFSSGRPTWGKIVGVAGNVRQANHIDAEQSLKPQVYAPFYQSSRIFGVYLVVRSSGDPLALIPAVQDRIWSVDRNQPITSVATLNQRVATVNASPRSQTLLLGIFAGCGFLLALIGVYGVMSYLVSLQTREFGIRVALGAAPAQVLRHVLTHGGKLACAGVIFGTIGGLLLSRFMSGLLFGISPTDALTYIAVSVALVAMALAAAYIPARRAARVDPLVVLRYE